MTLLEFENNTITLHRHRHTSISLRNEQVFKKFMERNLKKKINKLDQTTFILTLTISIK